MNQERTAIESPITGEMCGRPFVLHRNGTSRAIPGWFEFHESGFKRFGDWTDEACAGFGRWACADVLDLIRDFPAVQAWVRAQIYSHNYERGVLLFDVDASLAPPPGYFVVPIPVSMYRAA